MLGGDTAGKLTQTDQKPGVFDALCHHAGLGAGELAGAGRVIAAGECPGRRAVRGLPCVFPFFVYSSYQYYCC